MDRTAKSALGGIESRVTNAVLNYAASLVAMLLAYWYYTHASRYHIDLLDARLFIGSVEVSFPQVLLSLILLFAIAMVPYYLLCPDIRSEARVAAALAIDCWHNGRCARFGADEKQALLTLLLKVFFIPLMVNWTITHTAGVLNHFHELTNTVAQPNVSLLAMLNGGLYLMLFHLLMTIDLCASRLLYDRAAPSEQSDPERRSNGVRVACVPALLSAVQSVVRVVLSLALPGLSGFCAA